MKQILMALAVMAIAVTSTNAQVCKTKTAHRHRTAYTKPKETQVVQSEVCRTVPYLACKIMPDRKTVSCYQTTDLNNLTPLNNDVTLYGTTGRLPNEPVQTEMETTIIKGKAKSDYCVRDVASKTTTCSYNGLLKLSRDDDGFYNYR
jgi:hypothetical protein